MLCYWLYQKYDKQPFEKKEAIRCNGEIYSKEHRRRFEIKKDIFKMEENPTDKNELVLTINRQPISEWFTKNNLTNYGKVCENQKKNQEKAENLECKSFLCLEIKSTVF